MYGTMAEAGLPPENSSMKHKNKDVVQKDAIQKDAIQVVKIPQNCAKKKSRLEVFLCVRKQYKKSPADTTHIVYLPPSCVKEGMNSPKCTHDINGMPPTLLSNCLKDARTMITRNCGSPDAILSNYIICKPGIDCTNPMSFKEAKASLQIKQTAEFVAPANAAE